MDFFFTGGGDFDCFRRVDQNFLNALHAGDEIILLPYASDSDDFDEIYERVQDTYTNRNGVTIKFEERPDRITDDFFETGRAVFIEGGNTFDLISALRANNIETYLKKFSRGNDRILYADSAGAIVAGKSVRTAFFGDDADDDSDRLQDYRGLDLIDSWSIHAHYTPEDDDAIMNFVYEEGTPIVALYEETGIHISSAYEITVLTQKPAEIFTAAGKETLGFGVSQALSKYY